MARVRRKPKTKVARMRDAADLLFRSLLRRRDGNRCRLCGEPASTVHHVFTVGCSTATRYDPENGLSVCVACHCGCHSVRAAEYLARCQDTMGMEMFRRVRERHRQLVHWRVADWQEVYDTLQAGKCIQVVDGERVAVEVT